MLTKKLATYLVTAGICATPLLANANPLVIINNTAFSSTSIINNGACSTILGDSGITKPHSTNTISDAKLRIACLTNQHDCKADIYMTTNCSGPKVATMYFDTSTGIKADKMELYDKSFQVSLEAFKVSFSGGPAFASK